MNLKPTILQRLLISRSLLDRIRDSGIAQPDNTTIGLHVLISHDAAELVVAAIAEHLGCDFKGSRTVSLMDYFDPIAQMRHAGTVVPGKQFFSRLNKVRIDIKHYGIFPDPKEWWAVATNTYEHLQGLCSNYLEVDFGEIDRSGLLRDGFALHHYRQAHHAYTEGKYKKALEHLGIALYFVFKSNQALRGLQVGAPNPEDAIRLAGFGVHANDFLALQEFLPEIKEEERRFFARWTQSTHGHPGNWRKNAVQFSLDVFLDTALKIQDATWIPGAIDLMGLFEQKLEALKDGVEIFKFGTTNTLWPQEDRSKKQVLRTLQKGETFNCTISPPERRSGVDILSGRPQDTFYTLFVLGTPPLYGHVEMADVKIWLMPRDNDVVKQHFQYLTPIEWQPSPEWIDADKEHGTHRYYPSTES